MQSHFRRLVPLLVIVTWTTSSVACVNDYASELGELFDAIGLRIPAPDRTDWMDVASERERLRRAWSASVPKLEQATRTNQDPRLLTTLAAAYIHVGRSAEAVPLLHRVERIQPGLYQTASTLGTAYEMLGTLDGARLWIARSLERDPGGHGGSEWIHLRIIEAKERLATGGGIGPEGVLRLGTFLESRGDGMASREEPWHGSLDTLVSHIEMQLRERLQFVEAPDSTVGDLLLDLAALHNVRGEHERALGLLQSAEEYGTPRRGRLDAVRDEAETGSRSTVFTSFLRQPRTITMILAGGSALVISLVLLRRRRHHDIGF